MFSFSICINTGCGGYPPTFTFIQLLDISRDCIVCTDSCQFSLWRTALVFVAQQASIVSDKEARWFTFDIVWVHFHVHFLLPCSPTPLSHKLVQGYIQLSVTLHLKESRWFTNVIVWVQYIWQQTHKFDKQTKNTTNNEQRIKKKKKLTNMYELIFRYISLFESQLECLV